MTMLRIAVVGRPNVGKSSMTNMLAGRKVSITDDTPGTTRDRVSTFVTLSAEFEASPPITVELTDTGGYGVYTRSGERFDDAGKDLTTLTRDIESQIAKAVHNADLILLVVDAQAGVTPMDETVARLLREGGIGAIDAEGHTNESASTRVVVVANKADGPKWESHAYEAASLGFGEPLVVSAKNNYRRRELVERLHEQARLLIAARGASPAGAHDAVPEMKLAIVGKRNSGKSTLVNTLAGEQRVIVSEIAGTTRDAIDVRFTIDGRSLLAIDTAGLRRKKSFEQRIEWWALERMERAIDRCDVGLLMVDATEAISHVDAKVCDMLVDRFRPTVIVVNKWDLAQGRPIARGTGAGRAVTTEDFEAYLRKELPGLWYAPIAFMSAKNNSNVHDTINLAFELMAQSRARVGTGALNRAVRELLDKVGPASKSGSFAKVYYTAQIETNPPTLVLVVNKPELFNDQYRRFLLNRLRDQTPFGEVPIKLVIKGRQSSQVRAARGGGGSGAEELEKLVQQAAAVEHEQRASVGAPIGDWDMSDLANDPEARQAAAMAMFSDAPTPGKAVGRKGAGKRGAAAVSDEDDGLIELATFEPGVSNFDDDEPEGDEGEGVEVSKPKRVAKGAAAKAGKSAKTTRSAKPAQAMKLAADTKPSKAATKVTAKKVATKLVTAGAGKGAKAATTAKASKPMTPAKAAKAAKAAVAAKAAARAMSREEALARAYDDAAAQIEAANAGRSRVKTERPTQARPKSAEARARSARRTKGLRLN